MSSQKSENYGKRPEVVVLEHLYKNPDSFIGEISEATGYNNTTVHEILVSLKPIINERVGFKGEGENKAKGHLYSVDSGKISIVVELFDVFNQLDPRYKPKKLLEFLDAYTSVIVGKYRRKWVIQNLREDIENMIESIDEELKTGRAIRKSLQRRL